MTKISYAHARQPWAWRLKIVRQDTGEKMEDVVEVDARNGWLVRNVRDESGKLVPLQHGDLRTERIDGDFEILDLPTERRNQVSPLPPEAYLHPEDAFAADFG